MGRCGVAPGTALALAWSAPAAVRATLEEAEPRDPHGGSALSEAL
jgi:hypothetical protein